MLEPYAPLVEYLRVTVGRAFIPWREPLPGPDGGASDALQQFFTDQPDARAAVVEGATARMLLAIEDASIAASQAQRDALGVGLVFGNPILSDVIEQGIAPELITRRIDSVLEVLRSSFSTTEAQSVVLGYEQQLLALATGPGRMVMTHPLTAGVVNLANEASFVAWGVGIPFLDSAVQYGQSMLAWTPDDLSRLYALKIYRADIVADHDLTPMRQLSNELIAAIAEASRSHVTTASWTTMPQHLAILTASLNYVTAQLGDDDDFLPDIAPDLEGLRRDDAIHVCEILAITLTVDKVDGDWLNTLLDRDNFIVVRQRPRPGEPVRKRRHITVDIEQYRESVHGQAQPPRNDRPGMVFRVNTEGIAEQTGA